jgi:hypothetical protein
MGKARQGSWRYEWGLVVVWAQKRDALKNVSEMDTTSITGK